MSKSSWNNETGGNERDNFWMGFIPSFILPFIILVIIFKSKYTTEKPIFEALYKFSATGLLGKDLLASTIVCFVLLFVFNMLKKERASMGAFVGVVPYIILTFWIM